MSWKPNPQALPNFRAALAEYAALKKKDNPDGIAVLMRQSAARIVKNIVDITPPASGKADTAAKKRGENAIVSDLLKIAQPVQGITRKQAREVLASADELMQAHARAINAVGRVNPRSRKEKLQVLSADFVKIAALLGKRVGWLAAGMNAAAGKLGIRLPAWISRHGTKFGIIHIEFSATRFRIQLGQNVPYATNVKGYARKFDFAFKREVGTLQKMIKAITNKAHARARARLK